MWRKTPRLIFRSILAVHPTPLSQAKNPIPLPLLPSRLLSTTAPLSSPAAKSADEEADSVTVAEARRLMRLVNVDSLKKKMEVGGEEVIRYDDLLRECQQLGIARNADEARGFVKTLDEAGVVLLFRDMVYLHPEKVVLQHLCK